MADLPELPDSTKRRLTLQLAALLESHRLDGEHVRWHDQKRADLIREAEKRQRQTSRDRFLKEHQWEVDRVGILESMAVANAYFDLLAAEYRQLWSPSAGHEVFKNWLDILKGRILIDLAPIWKGKSESFDLWYERKCAPAIEGMLTASAKKWTAQVRDFEIQMLRGGVPSTAHSSMTSDQILDEIYAGGETLSPQAQRAVEMSGQSLAEIRRLRVGNLNASPDGSGTSKKVPPAARQGYGSEIRAFMKTKEGLRTTQDAANFLGVGFDTLKSIMSSRGKKRYSDETLQRVLKKIGHTGA